MKSLPVLACFAWLTALAEVTDFWDTTGRDEDVKSRVESAAYGAVFAIFRR